jgi:hypothetical protein
MKLTLTYEQLASATSAIRIIDLTTNPGEESLRISLSFCEPLFEHIDRFEEHNRRLLLKYGVKKNGIVTMTRGDENWDKFEKDYNALLEQKFEVEVELISMDLIKKSNMNPAQVRSLRPFIKVETDEKKDKK